MALYKDWLNKFKTHNLIDFTLTQEGVLWLKLRSIERSQLLLSFVQDAALDVDLTMPDKMEKIWALLCSNDAIQTVLTTFMERSQQTENEMINASFEEIRSNLYRMSEFHWGGGFRNSLDKAIVSRYVKTRQIIPYEQLDFICDGELRTMTRGYLRNSWYDYWSSILIENVFRRQQGVLPAPGKIKKVDFFIDDIPFDLKVTYIPKEYAKKIRKSLGIEEPIRRLQNFAKTHNIPFSNKIDKDILRYELEQKIQDAQTEAGNILLTSINNDWKQVVLYAKEHVKDLIKWLYENQGDMRFGAENRVFLILIDMHDAQASWKLKRNVELLTPAINTWVSSFKRVKIEEKRTYFSYNGIDYETFSDVIFVCKE